MPLPRRLWCSCTIIKYLAGSPEAADCEPITQQAAEGQLEIVVSILAEAEVIRVRADVGEVAEALIREFFGRNYVIRAALDVSIAEKARDIVRKYNLKPLDAVHVATALHHNIPILETFDDEMIEVSEKEGDPPLVIRRPVYEEIARDVEQGELFRA